MKSEVLFGIHPVSEALVSRRRHIHAIYLQKGHRPARLARLFSAAAQRGIGVKTVGSAELQALAGAGGHQGAAARVAPLPLTAVSDMLAAAEAMGEAPFLLMLDGIVDPQNLGAIIRTAVCAGIVGIITPKDRSAPPTPAVSKASAGALEHILLSRVTNLVPVIKECQKKGLWVAGLDKEAGRSIYDSDLTGPIVVVLGGEEKGIRPLVRKNCDFLVSIPQSGALDSLNVSAAAAVTMYEVLRQRQKR